MMNMQVPVKNIFFPFSGTNNVCVISTDEYGRMHPDVLEREIKELIRVGEKIPLMVNATFGTTVLGAIDPIDVSLIQAKELALEIECLSFLLNFRKLPRFAANTASGSTWTLVGAAHSLSRPDLST